MPQYCPTPVESFIEQKTNGVRTNLCPELPGCLYSLTARGCHPHILFLISSVQIHWYQTARTALRLFPFFHIIRKSKFALQVDELFVRGTLRGLFFRDVSTCLCLKFLSFRTYQSGIEVDNIRCIVFLVGLFNKVKGVNNRPERMGDHLCHMGWIFTEIIHRNKNRLCRTRR
jgi:hypothetical protein